MSVEDTNVSNEEFSLSSGDAAKDNLSGSCKRKFYSDLKVNIYKREYENYDEYKMNDEYKMFIMTKFSLF